MLSYMLLCMFHTLAPPLHEEIAEDREVVDEVGCGVDGVLEAKLPKVGEGDQLLALEDDGRERDGQVARRHLGLVGVGRHRVEDREQDPQALLVLHRQVTHHVRHRDALLQRRKWLYTINHALTFAHTTRHNTTRHSTQGEEEPY